MLLQSYLWREGIAVVELAERGAYRGYGTLPENSRQSPRGGPRSSMCSRPGTSYHRIKYANQWGPVPGGHLRQGRTRSKGGGGAILDGAGAGFAVEATEPAGGKGADTGAGVTKG